MLERLSSYDQFARGAARLAERLARLQQASDDPDLQCSAQGGEGARPVAQPPLPTTPTPAPTPLSRWRWVERRAPVTGEAVGVLELERWMPARDAELPPARGDDEEGEPERQAEIDEDEATVVAGRRRRRARNGAAATADANADSAEPPTGWHRYVFHAAYSRTYAAPVLCFAATRADGSPVGPEQVQRDLSPWLQEHAPPTPTHEEQGGGNGGSGGGGGGIGGAPFPSSSSSSFYLSRGEHPGGLPGAPAQVYFLHPCRTAERMALLMQRDGAAPAAAAPGAASSDAAADDGDDGGASAEAASRYLAAWLSSVAPAVGLPRPPEEATG